MGQNHLRCVECVCSHNRVHKHFTVQLTGSKGALLM